MSEALVLTLFIVALSIVLLKGPQWSLYWVYIPVLVLVPLGIQLDLVGLPELTPRRAACVGLILGVLLAGHNKRQLLPSWRWFDVLALLPVLSFSISYGLDTDFAGFYHRFAVLLLDWACPYCLARTFLTNAKEVQAMLFPLVLSTVVLAGLAAYECRMGTRLAIDLWNQLGLNLSPLAYFLSMRWGYLRAAATFDHPIFMGTFFALAAPLMVLWGLLDSRFRYASIGAAAACMAGCISSLSRGPILILLLVTVVFFLAVFARRFLIIASLVLFLLAGPFLIEMWNEEAQFVSKEMEVSGNTTSGHYRVALLMIYGKQILDVGPWGDRSFGRDLEYEKAWSIDNAYLFLFVTGGWLGGGTFCLIVVTVLFLGGRRVVAARAQERKILSATLASFASVAGCMANVWFSPGYSPFFWLTAGLVINSTSSSFLAVIKTVTARTRRHPDRMQPFRRRHRPPVLPPH